MTVRCILDNRLPSDLLNSSDIEDTLNNLLDVFEWMNENECFPISYDSGSDGLYEQNAAGIDFIDWLYNPKIHAGIPKDLMREFCIRIERCRPLDTGDYEALLKAVEAVQCGAEGELVVSVHTDTANVLYIATEGRCWAAKQWYLSSYVKKSEFVQEASGCFPNLFFHGNVSASIHTLNVDFTQERPLIVRHLCALNNFSAQFQELHKNGASRRKLCSEFEKHTGIACTAQAGRDGTQNLYWDFTNYDNKQVSLCCECHTKLKYKDMDHQKQDRIYFFPCSPDIEHDKVLIAHIGKHL